MPIVDFHNHLMPGVDDGAQSAADAAHALAAFKQDGVGVVVTTPHVDGSLTLLPAALAERLASLDAAFEVLQGCAAAAGDIRVERGAELLLDAPELDLSDARLRLAGTRSFLMEFPFGLVPPYSPRVVKGLASGGHTPIIAHPERYRDVWSQPELAAEWRDAGAYLQLNGASLLGYYGPEVRGTAFELLRRGWVDYICSDYHARGSAQVAQYRALLEASDGAEQAQILMQTNPSRMLDGLSPLPVAGLQMKPTLWNRVAGIFR
jgi:protein-tyrosine phosphatase